MINGGMLSPIETLAVRNASRDQKGCVEVFGHALDPAWTLFQSFYGLAGSGFVVLVALIHCEAYQLSEHHRKSILAQVRWPTSW